ncbi:hypothetical protein E3N88_17939 [Mikania micrantha]|uniref:RRM domain-containing protein n=1 Tax=Mikania micrantha TaxID=192012 RepID=A0A5N6NV21_9ASTR|nr:hypothetical protein E3N88_17939 [Mikania micrantha]
MAEIVLPPLLQVIFEKLASPLLQTLGNKCGLEENFKRIQQILPMIQAVVETAEQRQITDTVVRIWISQLKDTVDQAVDFLEDFTNKAYPYLLLEEKYDMPKKWLSLRSVSTSTEKVRNILQVLEAAAAEGLQNHHLKEAVYGANNVVSDERATGSFVIESQVFGRDKDRKRITEFLIVFDDVWNEDEEKWDKLRPLFHGGASGSKILVTTRSEKVAMIIDPNHASSYHLKGLADDDCWNLFERRAFRQGDLDKHPNLLEIGKQILGKCRGVPLAVKTLGSLMRFKRKEEEWLAVQNSDVWHLDACNQGGIIAALMLSYLHLPSHLKYCFTFCSVFPKHYLIERKKLILIWMAEGLIQSQEGTQPEDTGDDYFKELLWMSFFEEIEENQMKMYKLHDLFYDLARSLTRNDTITLESGTGISPSNASHIRHLSIESSGSFQLLETFHQAGHMRTLLLLSCGGYDAPVHPKMLASFTYLRVLDVSYCNTQLPESLGDLRCLKHLDQSHSSIKSLPIRVNLLRSLLTINLSSCSYLYQLPDLQIMQNLRHLNIAGCDRLTHMPSGIEGLLQLQTLPLYIVSRVSSLDVLGPLNLRGELKIKHLENVHKTEEAKEANIWKKGHLTSLGLCWGCDDSNLIMNPTSKGSLSWLLMGKKDAEPEPSEPTSTTNSMAMDGKLAEEALSCLRPHKNVKGLHVLGYPGFAFPSTFSKWLLPKLSTVELINCREILCLPTLGHLLGLKTLKIEGMNKVEKIGQELYGKDKDTGVAFPSLQELHIKEFPALESWCGMEDKIIFPLLRKLTIKNCPNLIEAPIFLSLQHLSLQSCSSRILEPTSKLTSLLTLVIHDFVDLISLPGELLENNSLLASLDIISCPNLQSLPLEFQSLDCLQTLTIRWCQRLSSLPKGFQKLTALKSLEITECHSITSLGEEIGGLKSLKTLSVENCSNLGLISPGLQHLSSLEHLTIMYCSNLAFLPDGFQHLLSLKRLTLINCPELQLLPESLKFATKLQSLQLHSCSKLGGLAEWFDNFVCLRSLTISDCQNVTSLPVGLRRLTALQHLSIHHCPVLKQRCWPKNGVDWWKIAHVPHNKPEWILQKVAASIHRSKRTRRLQTVIGEALVVSCERTTANVKSTLYVEGCGCDDDMGDKGWKEVRRKKTGRRPAQQNKYRKTFTVPNVANLPDGCAAQEMTKEFQKFGVVLDSYVARKKDKAGNTFGFVRFEPITDTRSLELNINSIKMGNLKLVVNVAKFDKDGNPTSVENKREHAGR